MGRLLSLRKIKISVPDIVTWCSNLPIIMMTFCEELPCGDLHFISSSLGNCEIINAQDLMFCGS